jgi:hypothetical protein
VFERKKKNTINGEETLEREKERKNEKKKNPKNNKRRRSYRSHRRDIRGYVWKRGGRR